MEIFRFGIMGAGNISNKFADAVKQLDGCEISAVAARSTDRAREFAQRHGIANYYGSYAEMLDSEDLDAVYIGTVTGTHCELTMLCLEHSVPVICEKAMFMNSDDAKRAFALAKEKNVFVMEAMWSRFLPAVVKAKSWIDSGLVGKVRAIDVKLGFLASSDPDRRYYNKAQGGGVCFDLTVYAYEVAKLFLPGEDEKINVDAVFADTGVDISNVVTVSVGDAVASLMTTFAAGMDEKMVIYGDKGKVTVSAPHIAKSAHLVVYGKGEERYEDLVTVNGFAYQAAEVVRSVKEGRIESETVPWSLTLAAARLYDMIYAKK